MRCLFPPSRKMVPSLAHGNSRGGGGERSEPEGAQRLYNPYTHQIYPTPIVKKTQQNQRKNISIPGVPGGRIIASLQSERGRTGRPFCGVQSAPCEMRTNEPHQARGASGRPVRSPMETIQRTEPREPSLANPSGRIAVYLRQKTGTRSLVCSAAGQASQNAGCGTPPGG